MSPGLRGQRVSSIRMPTVKPYRLNPPRTRTLAVQLDDVLPDPPRVRRVGLERQVLLERRLRPGVVLLLVVQQAELPMRIGQLRIELGRALVTRERLARELALVLAGLGPLRAQPVQVAVVEMGE